jgi:hypothetical protein
VSSSCSSAFHPQMDSQSEVTNCIIVMYLWCLAGGRPCSWLQWLPWAVFCFNTSTNPPFGPLHFRSSMAGCHRLWWLTCRARLVWLPSIVSSKIVMSSWLRFGSTSS